MTFTVEELDDAIENYEPYSDGWCILDDEEYELETKLGTVKQVEEGRDYVDEYEFSTWMVITINGRFFKKTGYYMSYDGSNWDGKLIEVEKKPVTREEWVAI